jgi:acetoin utilization deacetylase AcuC-like enzyme
MQVRTPPGHLRVRNAVLPFYPPTTPARFGGIFTRMNVGWVYDDIFLEHDTGPMHPEHAGRLRTIVEALTHAGLLAKMTPLAFGPADVETIGRVHDSAYIDRMRIACERGEVCVGPPDTRICRRSYDAALMAVGGVLAACDAVMAGRVRRAFCAVRPPGHHAEYDLPMGFCIFNNVAIAADHLVRVHGLQRVAIVDFDVHHGNGTQHLMELRDDVLFISLHEHPKFLFPGTGYDYEHGSRRGDGYTLNIPMLPGAGDADYRRALDQQILPALTKYRPQFLLISAGFDAVHADPLADIDLEPASYTWMTEALVAAAETLCDGRLVSVLEGGYDMAALAESVVRHVRALGVDG